MKKWLLVLVLILVFYVLALINKKKKKEKGPLLKKINYVISVIAWVFLVAYGIAFLYWLYTLIFNT